MAAPDPWQGQSAPTKTAPLRALGLKFSENQAFEGMLVHFGGKTQAVVSEVCRMWEKSSVSQMHPWAAAPSDRGSAAASRERSWQADVG